MNIDANRAVRDARKSQRFPTNFAGELRMGRQRYPVTVSDLSCEGAFLRGDQIPARGSEVILIARALEVVATVAWSKADACGLHFHRPVFPLEVVRQNAVEMMRFRQMRAPFGPRV